MCRKFTLIFSPELGLNPIIARKGAPIVQETKRKSHSKCAECGLETQERICTTHEGKASKNCPTLSQAEILKEANKLATYKSETGHSYKRPKSV
jgi:hypothetical protein